tara:strand:+ start:878 stop:1840 length:963 start_codon:yes stop_codon:yes gene_type:complete
MALQTKKESVLIETESSYNDNTTPTGQDAVLVTELSVTPIASDVVSRDYVRPYLGASEQLLANSRVEVSFSVELVGSGAAGTAPGYSKALLACGLSETVASGTSVTYTPVSAAFSSVVLFVEIGGSATNENVLHKIRGCRGNVSLEAAVGQIPKLNFSFTGIYETPIDLSSMTTPTYNDQPTPLLFKAGNTSGFNIHGHQAGLNSLSMDLGNSIIYREVIGSTSTKEVLLTDRAAGGSVVIDAVKPGVKDFFTAAQTDGTLGNLAFLHGTSAGHKVQFTSTKADLGDITYGDSDGIVTMEIPYTLVPSAAGNDEFSLIYT